MGSRPCGCSPPVRISEQTRGSKSGPGSLLLGGLQGDQNLPPHDRTTPGTFGPVVAAAAFAIGTLWALGDVEGLSQGV